MSVLTVEGLVTEFATRDGVVRAVDAVSFTLARGRVLGVVGESGSGKSVTGLSIMRLVDAPGRIAAGRVLYGGHDLLTLDERAMRDIRGNRIAMIFQDPMMTLNPVLSIGTQMTEAVHAHAHMRRTDARARARDRLGEVGIARPEERLDAYPHQFSGGMRQRVAIAIALLHEPDVIIADEPTTALDVTIQAQILARMQALAAGRGLALVWISHDLSVVSGLADDIAVMYAGKIVEAGPARGVLTAPLHPYTRGLLDSVPGRTPRGVPLAQISGVTPSLASLPPGCAFAPRCPRGDAACAAQPGAFALAPGRTARCFHPLGVRTAA